jgi:hypothetical protein
MDYGMNRIEAYEPYKGFKLQYRHKASRGEPHKHFKHEIRLEGH